MGAGAGCATRRTMREAVRAHCAERLARFKRPARVEVVDELPLTVTGKVQKGRLRGTRAPPDAGTRSSERPRPG